MRKTDRSQPAGPHARDVTSRRRAHLVPLLTLSLVTVAVYANAMPNGLHLDDFYRVAGNPGIERLTLRHFVDPSTMSTLPRITQYRPMLPLTLSLNYALTGHDVVGYHVGNLLIALAAALLAYFFLLALCAQAGLAHARGLAWVAAMLFAVHPVTGILVNYVCARDQSLMQVFLLASLLLHLRARRLGFTVWRVAGAALCLALSMLSKTDGAVAPVLIVLIEVTIGRERFLSWRPWLRALPSLLVVVGFFAFVRLGLGFSDLAQVMDTSPEARATYPQTQLHLHLFRYVANFFWPLGIQQDPAVPALLGLGEPTVLVGLLFVLASLALAAWCWRPAPLVTLCILAYWALIAPTSSFLPFHQRAVDYRPYPGSVFFYLLLTLLGARLTAAWTSPWARRALGALAVAYCAAAAVYQNTTWRTEETLWGHAVRRGGGALAHHNFAMSVGDLRVREKHMREALRQAPHYILAHMNLGRALVAMGRVDEGLGHCQTAVRIDPRIGQTRYWMAVTYAELGRHAEAAAESELAAAFEPNNAAHRMRAAQDALAAGKATRALTHIEALRSLAPNWTGAAELEGRIRAALPR